MRQIDEIFAVERDLYGLPADRRLAERQRLCAALVDELHSYMIGEREDPQAWLADVLSRIADMPQNRLAELLPWNWTSQAMDKAA